MTRNRIKCPKCKRSICEIVMCTNRYCKCEDIFCPKCNQIIGTKTKGIMTEKEWDASMMEFCED